MKRIVVLAPFLLAAALSFALGTGEGGDFEYDGIREIEIAAGTFAVDAQGTRGRTTSLEVRNDSDNFRVLHTRSGDRLEIWVERKFSFFDRSHRGELVLLVPRDTDLRIRTSTGSVDIRNITSDRLSVDTTTGDITLEEISTSMSVETSTGAVEILDSAGRFDIKSTTGEIELLRATGDVVAESSTGDHSYHDLIGDLLARSTTGRIEIDGMQGTLDLRTSTAKVCAFQS